MATPSSVDRRAVACREPVEPEGSNVNAGDGAEVWLFSYGTLRQTEVQLALFGRALDGQDDVLPGYAVSPLQITDPSVIATSGSALHTIAGETGDPLDRVPGTAFRITAAELAAADAYEVADCARVTVRLGSGIAAFVYVSAEALGGSVPRRAVDGS
jgi:hypothetical protein